jgi:hypothetical protein
MKPMVFFIRKKLRKKNFWKKKSNWPPKKKLIFQFRQFSFSLKFFFQGLVLGLVGLIDAKGIDVAQPIWL